MSAPGTNRLVPSSSPSPEAREDERYEQDTTGCGQGDNRNEQILLLSLEIVELLGIWGGGGIVAIARNCIPDVRSQDTLGREELWTISIDSANGVVTLRVDTVDKEVRDDVLGTSRFLRETQVTVTVLLDEGGAVTQPTSDERGVKEGSGGISLVSDDDDGVLQCAVPRTGEPFHSASGPSVAVVSRLRELATDWK